jgi:hypothetical protein
VYPGQNALYSISVTADGGTADDVTVQIALPAGQTTSGLPDPIFNICNHGSGTQVCALDTMRENASSQIQAEVAVPSKSAGGGTVTLAATVTAAAVGANSTGSVTDSASVDVNKSSTSTGHPGGGGGGGGGSGKGKTGSSGKGGSGNGSTGSGNGGSSTTGDTQPFDNLPPLSAGDGSGSTGSGGSSNLFPTINPSSGSGGSSNGSQGTKAAHKPYKATTVADILPLNSGQLSGQVAGLIVLALGIVLVFARISLRKPRGAQTKE